MNPEVVSGAEQCVVTVSAAGYFIQRGIFLVEPS